MDAGELDFCVYFLILDRESFFLLFTSHKNRESEREAEITSCDSASVLCIIYMSIALGSIKSKKEYYTY